MTSDEMDRAIAEYVGWNFDPAWAHNWGSRGKWCESPQGEQMFVVSIPKFSTDLNAMNEAEKAAFKGSALWVEFAANLLNVLQASEMSVSDGMACVLQATAAQRAKAFLKTIGKWRDE